MQIFPTQNTKVCPTAKIRSRKIFFLHGHRLSGADPGFIKGGDFCKGGGGSDYLMSDDQNM